MDELERNAFKKQLRRDLPQDVYEIITARDSLSHTREECLKDGRGCSVSDIDRVIKLLDDMLYLKLDIDTYRSIREELFDQ